MHAVARGLQHRDGSARVLRLEVTIEGIDEKHDFAAAGVALALAKIIAAPFWQRALRGKADERLADRREKIRHRREPRRPWRVARQESDRAVLHRQAVAFLVVVE